MRSDSIESEESIELMEQGSNRKRHSRKINIEEIKEVFSNRNFRRGFSIFDENKDGVIDIRELKTMVQKLSNEEGRIPSKVVKKIMDMTDTDNDGFLNYCEFVKMIENPTFGFLFEKYLNAYVKIIVPGRKYARADQIDGKSYEEVYSCWPPPIIMIIISLIEIIFYLYDFITVESTEGTGPMAIALMYNPYKRYQVWRFITYMFVHIGNVHLCVNLVIQVLIGIPLEMVHNNGRVAIIYFAGVIAGSLTTSLTDPRVFLAGASGGVYSLFTAHIAAVIMNWKETSTALVQLLIFLTIVISDFGLAIYNRYYLQEKDNIGFEAHVGGAVAGLLVGIFVLRNLETNKCENKLWWLSFITFWLLVLVAVAWNFAWPEYFPKQKY